MKISEILEPRNNLKNSRMLENATVGASSSASVASVAQPFAHVMSRQPNLFGYAAPAKPKKKQVTKRAKK